jgi:hypothetical protein
MLHFAPDSTFLPAVCLELARGERVEQGRGHINFDPRWLLPRIRMSDTSYEANGTAQKRFIQMGPFEVNAEMAGVFSVNYGVGETVSIPVVDPWLLATLDSIADHRDLHPGWDGMDAVAPSRECLDAAEALAGLFSGKPMTDRPQFAVDAEGKPSFATYSDRLYLHLTIDGPDRISWYAVADGDELFEDDVLFDGVELPAALERIL